MTDDFCSAQVAHPCAHFKVPSGCDPIEETRGKLISRTGCIHGGDFHDRHIDPASIRHNRDAIAGAGCAFDLAEVGDLP